MLLSGLMLHISLYINVFFLVFEQVCYVFKAKPSSTLADMMDVFFFLQFKVKLTVMHLLILPLIIVLQPYFQ